MIQLEFPFIIQEIGPIYSSPVLTDDFLGLSLSEIDNVLTNFGVEEDLHVGLSDIEDAFKQIENQKLQPNTILMHPDTFEDLKELV